MTLKKAWCCLPLRTGTFFFLYFNLISDIVSAWWVLTLYNEPTLGFNAISSGIHFLFVLIGIVCLHSGLVAYAISALKAVVVYLVINLLLWILVIVAFTAISSDGVMVIVLSILIYIIFIVYEVMIFMSYMAELEKKMSREIAYRDRQESQQKVDRMPDNLMGSVCGASSLRTGTLIFLSLILALEVFDLWPLLFKVFNFPTWIGRGNLSSGFFFLFIICGVFRFLSSLIAITSISAQQTENAIEALKAVIVSLLTDSFIKTLYSIITIRVDTEIYGTYEMESLMKSLPHVFQSVITDVGLNVCGVIITGKYLAELKQTASPECRTALPLIKQNSQSNKICCGMNLRTGTFVWLFLVLIYYVIETLHSAVRDGGLRDEDFIRSNFYGLNAFVSGICGVTMFIAVVALMLNESAIFSLKAAVSTLIVETFFLVVVMVFRSLNDAVFKICGVHGLPDDRFSAILILTYIAFVGYAILVFMKYAEELDQSIVRKNSSGQVVQLEIHCGPPVQLKVHCEEPTQAQQEVPCAQKCNLPCTENNPSSTESSKTGYPVVPSAPVCAIDLE